MVLDVRTNGRIQHSIQVFTPSLAYASTGYDVIHDHTPTNHKGEKFSDCDVRIGVGGASLGHTGSELRIAQPCMGTGEKEMF